MQYRPDGGLAALIVCASAVVVPTIIGSALTRDGSGESDPPLADAGLINAQSSLPEVALGLSSAIAMPVTTAAGAKLIDASALVEVAFGPGAAPVVSASLLAAGRLTNSLLPQAGPGPQLASAKTAQPAAVADRIAAPSPLAEIAVGPGVAPVAAVALLAAAELTHSLLPQAGPGPQLASAQTAQPVAAAELITAPSPLAEIAVGPVPVPLAAASLLAAGRLTDSLLPQAGPEPQLASATTAQPAAVAELIAAPSPLAEIAVGPVPVPLAAGALLAAGRLTDSLLPEDALSEPRREPSGSPLGAAVAPPAAHAIAVVEARPPAALSAVSQSIPAARAAPSALADAPAQELPASLPQAAAQVEPAQQTRLAVQAETSAPQPEVIAASRQTTRDEAAPTTPLASAYAPSAPRLATKTAAVVETATFVPARPMGEAARAQSRFAQDDSADLQVSPFPAPDPSLASPAAPIHSLQEALMRTYQTSPTLMAQRAELRGLDSGVALARSAGRPQIDVGANFNQDVHVTRQIGRNGRNLNASADVAQVIFAGGRIRNSVRAADTQVIAGRADLRATEGAVFTEAVAVYASLVRDRDIREFNVNQVRVLEANYASARARLRVGDLTKADVSQSEARLALARSSLATAEGRLQSSEENFERVVGARAGRLEPLPPLPSLPPTADHAVETALAENADVAAFVSRARAARYNVDATKAERMPTISAVGSTDYSNALGTADQVVGLPKGTLANTATNIGAGFSLRLPLYQGGAASARVRQAEEASAQLMEQAIAAERLAVASARSAFAIWRSALTAITSNEAAVASNEVALASVKIEQTVGARSILDVLNAEQELLSGRIALAGARRDAYVAAFELLNTMGAAEATDLNLGDGSLYDPQANYRAYAHTESDWADGPRRTPASTRNVPEQVDSPLTRLKSGIPNESEKRP